MCNRFDRRIGVKLCKRSPIASPVLDKPSRQNNAHETSASNIPLNIFIPSCSSDEESEEASTVTTALKLSRTGVLKDQSSRTASMASECSSRLPRLPCRQASIEEDLDRFTHQASRSSPESKPKLPCRCASTESADFEAWLSEPTHSAIDPPTREVAGAAKIAPMDARRYSCPGTRVCHDHFRHIADPDAGGRVPVLPRRQKSARNVLERHSSPSIRTSPVIL